MMIHMRKLIKNKRGDGDFEGGNQLINIVNILLFAGFILLLVMFFGGIISSIANVPADFELQLLTYRFYMSPDCFAYTDNTGRVYPGVISIEGKTDYQLMNCFNPLGKEYSYAYSAFFANKEAERIAQNPNTEPAPSSAPTATADNLQIPPSNIPYAFNITIYDYDAPDDYKDFSTPNWDSRIPPAKRFSREVVIKKSSGMSRGIMYVAVELRKVTEQKTGLLTSK